MSCLYDGFFFILLCCLILYWFSVLKIFWFFGLFLFKNLLKVFFLLLKIIFLGIIMICLLNLDIV